MKKILLLFVCLLVTGAGSLWAQSRQVSGIVTENGQPLTGVSVTVKGTTIASITNEEGRYSVDVPENATLVFVFLGMKTQEIAVGARSTINVEMVPEAKQLEDVIIVAYGTTTKEKFTGSASTIKSEKIGSIQTSEVSNTLAGQVAGVQATKSSGQPGTGSTIRIRGIGSMSASNGPLYVVDGTPYDGDIAAINTQDIESMTVLKDAAANSLYGSRGANGVILITTKSGFNQEAKITFDAKWGTNRRAIPQYNVMVDPGMYYETAYQAIYNGRYNGANAQDAHVYANNNLFTSGSGGVGYQVYTLPNGEFLIGTSGKLNPNATLGYSDGEYYYLPDNWADELFDKNNLRQEYNLSMTGGKEGLSYYGSFGYLDDSGIAPGSGFSRYTARIKTDYQMKKWLKVGVNAVYTHYDLGYPDDQDGSSSSGNLFYLSNYIAPVYPLYVRNPDGSIKKDNRGHTVYDFGDRTSTNSTRAFMTSANPASLLELDKTQYLSNIFNGQTFAEVEFIQGLKGKATLSYFTDDTRWKNLYNAYYGQYAGVGGIAYVGHTRMTALNQQYLLTYNKTIAHDHHLDVLLGYEGYSYKTESLQGSREMLYNPEISEINNGILNHRASSSAGNYSTVGIFSRLQYDYLEKYFVSASYRRDASSRFHPDNRWGDFWAFGAAWVLNKESFMSGFDWIDLLKLKASYGAQGNDNIGNLYAYLDQFTVSENNGDFATTLAYKGNKDLTWESSLTANIGVDFEFFDQRLNGTVEYFSRQTSDMLYYKPVPSSLGYSSVPVNIGSVRNSGVELDINGEIFRTKDFLWQANFNATFLSNKILKLDPALNGEWISGSRIYREGESMYQFYMRQYAGVNDQGYATWYLDETDADGNVTGVTTTDDWSTATQYASGDILPTVYGGFGTQLEWKGFDFGILFSYQLGGRMYDNTYAALMHSGGSGNAGTNWHADILNAWTPGNTNTSVPKLSTDTKAATANNLSDRFIFSSDYLSLQNVTIGYKLPKFITDKLSIASVRVYAVADNVWLFSARQGFDPRQSYTANSNANYSIIRTISGGITVTF
jgi:TonB-linked SusC/RagA family outer membrane protein